MLRLLALLLVLGDAARANSHAAGHANTKSDDLSATDSNTWVHFDHSTVSNGERLSRGDVQMKSDSTLMNRPLHVGGAEANGWLASMDPPVGSELESTESAGKVFHQIFRFPAPLKRHAYFNHSGTILALLADNTVWQSSNEGFSWKQLFPQETFLDFYHNPFRHDRAYLITPTRKLYYTTSTGRTWITIPLPAPANVQNLPLLSFHPLHPDWLIWTGAVGCDGENCHAAAWYTTNHGRRWQLVERYVHTCSWARGAGLLVDPSLIMCGSYKHKAGKQSQFTLDSNPLELVAGTHFYGTQEKLFNRIVGFVAYSDVLLISELPMDTPTLGLQVSRDWRTFSRARFPSQMSVGEHAYTVFDSATESVFVHLTTSDRESVEWGNLLKSDGNGTLFGLSLEHVNRNEVGFVDFEQLLGLGGVALLNIVSNTDDAERLRRKDIQTRITHNDGGRWEALVPPTADSFKQEYACEDTTCALHLHAATEGANTVVYSNPAVVGLLVAAGNVGKKLTPYADSDMFLSRDAGFTWEETRKGAHQWVVGDSGSVIVMVESLIPTNHVLYSLDQGLTWTAYQFADEKLHSPHLVTVPTGTSRKFVLIARTQRESHLTVVIYFDFSGLLTRQCNFDPSVPDADFELWSPAADREEQCLFGRQVVYPRRRRSQTCFVGDDQQLIPRMVRTCSCTENDFECEFNHVRDQNGTCVLLPGAEPLPDGSCAEGADFWYERTAYRKIPHSTCDGGLALDHGARRRCDEVDRPTQRAHRRRAWFWMLMVVPAAVLAGLAIYIFIHRRAHADGEIRLPD